MFPPVSVQYSVYVSEERDKEKLCWAQYTGNSRPQIYCFQGSRRLQASGVCPHINITMTHIDPTTARLLHHQDKVPSIVTQRAPEHWLRTKQNSRSHISAMFPKTKHILMQIKLSDFCLFISICFALFIWRHNRRKYSQKLQTQSLINMILINMIGSPKDFIKMPLPVLLLCKILQVHQC